MEALFPFCRLGTYGVCLLTRVWQLATWIMISFLPSRLMLYSFGHKLTIDLVFVYLVSRECLTYISCRLFHVLGASSSASPSSFLSLCLWQIFVFYKLHVKKGAKIV
jgi:hypothetical protein